MSTNYRRFNNSTTVDYNNNTSLANGNLSWDDSNGLRLHDGETKGGKPVIGVHERWNTVAQVSNIGGSGGGTFYVASGDQTTQGWAQVGQTFYFERDINENPQTITACSYDGNLNVTVVTVNSGYFNGYNPTNGETIYQTVHPTTINQLAEGPGIRLDLNSQRLTVTPRFFGQHREYLTESTLNTGIQINNLPASLITCEVDPSYTTGTLGETHTITLPFDGMQNQYWSPDADLCVGTRITVINNSQFNVDVTGWPGPGWTLLPFGSSVDMVYQYNAEYGGNLWSVVGAFTWP